MKSILHAEGAARVVHSNDWFSEIVAGGYRAIIFDCDGTLVESREVHLKSFQTAVAAQGFQMDRNWYFSRTGLDRNSTLSEFALYKAPKLDVKKAAEKSIEQFIALSSEVTVIAETTGLVKSLSASYPMAVGTNAENDVAKASLHAAGLLPFFETLVSISDVPNAKPAPDIFLEATKRLSFSHTETLVFEDSAEGVKAAAQIGLDVVQII